MALQIGAGVGDQREAGGVGFGEAVQRERGDGLHDGVLRLSADAVLLHAGAQADLDVAHPRLGAFEAHRAPQLLGLAPAETGGDHRHAQKLFLKQRDAQRAAQHRLQRRMQALGLLPALAAPQKRMQHFSDDGAGPDDGHLHHDVVELLRAQPRQAGHLRAALHLEHADGVGVAQRRIHQRIVRGQMRQIDALAIRLADDPDRLLQYRHHPQAQQIHLDDAHVRAVFFIPLHHHAAGHRGRLERNDRVQLALADDHAAGVLAQMARQIPDL